jgi:hypothetical protein
MVAFLKASPSCASPVNREVCRKSTHRILSRCGTSTGGTLRGLEYERYFRIFILQLWSGNDSNFTIRGSTFPEAGSGCGGCFAFMQSWRGMTTVTASSTLGAALTHADAEVGPSQCCSPFEQTDHGELSWIRMPAAIHSIKVYSLLTCPSFNFHASGPAWTILSRLYHLLDVKNPTGARCQPHRNAWPFPVHVMLRASPPTSILTCQFLDPAMKNIRLVRETQLFIAKDTMESKNLRSRFSVVRQLGSALSKVWMAVLKVL